MEVYCTIWLPLKELTIGNRFVIYLLLFCYIFLRLLIKDPNTPYDDILRKIHFRNILRTEKTENKSSLKLIIFWKEPEKQLWGMTKKNIIYLNPLLKLWMANCGVDLVDHWLSFTFIKNHFKTLAFINPLSEAGSLKT